VAVPTDVLRVARSGSTVYVRVCGLGCFRNAHILEEFCAGMIETGYRWFLIDLKECRGMDSTFMGVLVGLSSFLGDQKDTGIILVNGDRHNLELIENLGLNRIVSVVHKAVQFPEVESEVLEDSGLDDEARLEVVRRAHSHLCEIDKRNAERFGPFLEQLAREVGDSARLKAGIK
jgi:anti-anti-sigma regulatory factor